MKKKWTVTLGSDEWAMFTPPRPPQDHQRRLGRVPRGAPVGARAHDRPGRDVAVQGDQV